MSNKRITNEILRRLHFYLGSGCKVGHAFERTIDDAKHLEDLGKVIEEVLVPEIAVLFAEKYDKLGDYFDLDDDHSLNNIFDMFCRFESIEQDLANEVATTINEAAAQDFDEEEGEGDEDDDDDVVFKDQEWAEMSDSERQAKVKAFLVKLANAHLNMRDGKAFLKNLNVGDQEDPYGNKHGITKTFDRAKHHFGHGPNESAIQSANLPHAFNIEDLKNHPLHRTATKHGYEYFHSTPVTQKNGDVVHYHVWKNELNHQIGAYHNDTKWTSKVSPSSGHVHTGNGSAELERHLKNKAKRKLPESGSLPHNKLQEGLIDLASQERVKAYADWLNKNPATSFGVAGNPYAVDSPAKDLIEAAKLREKQEKMFGDSNSRFDLFDQRSGRPK